MNEARAWKAGTRLAHSVIEMINLMYQNETALKFISALCIELNTERKRRMEEVVDKDE